MPTSADPVVEEIAKLGAGFTCIKNAPEDAESPRLSVTVSETATAPVIEGVNCHCPASLDPWPSEDFQRYEYGASPPVADAVSVIVEPVSISRVPARDTAIPAATTSVLSAVVVTVSPPASVTVTDGEYVPAR